MSDTWKGNDYQAVWWDETAKFDGPGSDLIDEVLQDLIDEGLVTGEMRPYER